MNFYKRYTLEGPIFWKDAKNHNNKISIAIHDNMIVCSIEKSNFNYNSFYIISHSIFETNSNRKRDDNSKFIYLMDWLISREER